MIGAPIEQDLAQQLGTTTDRDYRDIRFDMEEGFMDHLKKLDSGVELMPTVAEGGIIPADASYPRRFIDARRDLADQALFYAREISAGDEFDSGKFLEQVMNFCKRVAVQNNKKCNSGRVEEIYAEIPRYTRFQLLCLLRQIQKGEVDPRLVKALSRPEDNKVIDRGLALTAGIKSVDIFSASRLLGTAHLAHDNRSTLLDLLTIERPAGDAYKLVQSRIAELSLEFKEDLPGYAKERLVARSSSAAN